MSNRRDVIIRQLDDVIHVNIHQLSQQRNGQRQPSRCCICARYIQKFLDIHSKMFGEKDDKVKHVDSIETQSESKQFRQFHSKDARLKLLPVSVALTLCLDLSKRCDCECNCKPILVNDLHLSEIIVENLKSTSVQPPNPNRPLNSELAACILEIKVWLAETLIFLDFLENCHEKTDIERLKLLCDRGKNTCKYTCEMFKKLHNLLNIISSGNGKFRDENDDQDCHQLNCEDQPRSISEESLRKSSAKGEKLCPNSKTLPWQYKESVIAIKNGGTRKKEREKNSEQEYASLKWKTERLERENVYLKEQLQDVLAELGELSVEKTASENAGRKSEFFQKIFRSSSPEAKRSDVSADNDKPEDGSRANGSSQAQSTNESVNSPRNGSAGEQSLQGAEAVVPGSNHQEARISSTNPAMQDSSSDGETTSVDTSGNVRSDEATSRDESSQQTSNKNLAFPVQQDDLNGREFITLGIVPATSVARALYNNYKLLLLSLGQCLLSSDVLKLTEWASQDFLIVNTQNPTDVLVQLDQKGIINASNLSSLRDFFESILRIDLVVVIDEFLLGDYSLLREIAKKRETHRTPTSQFVSRYTSLLNTLNSSQSLPQSRNPATSREPENRSQNSVSQQSHQSALSSFLAYSNNGHLVSRSPNENQSHGHEQRNVKPIASGFAETSVVVTDGLVTNERRTMASNSSTGVNPAGKHNSSRIGSNGSNPSMFSRQNPNRSRNVDQEKNWLCSHYKRLCQVKFECCDRFWPCHRCHNNESTCGQKKRKSRDTQMIKCVNCNKVQQFAQFCCDCGTKFANYFCGLCQHLTGKDDHPYHCDKCGICRIHGDRSFHCDVCGVCLDVQLRGNHKCREGSAHDECCICLEDAFTGCQILPCSHKVHKECATQMIRSGITRCPICRESFAHKLERRPMPNSRKRPGK